MRIRDIFRPPKKRGLTWLMDGSQFDKIECAGYTNLAHNPEIEAGVDVIARLVGSMTIHLMQNTEKGDVRVTNELSKKIDVYPFKNMTRANFVRWIVRTMYLEGRGNCVVLPKTRGGIIKDLLPVPASKVSFAGDTWDYKVTIDGKDHSPDDVLHFVLKPGTEYPWKGDGYQVTLQTVANNLKQARATETGFMSSKWKPSLIVKVDALIDEFSSPEGRRKLLDSYAASGEAGEPWVIPAEQFSVEQVKPLTLADLALADFVKLDKRAVASILGVPAFVLGEGEFNRDAWNNFIATTIMPLALNIQQELTRKLLISPDLYFRFNSRSLYSYSLTELVTAGKEMVDRIALTRNEWRDWVGLPPNEEMEELIGLENFIPATMLGQQSKLKGGDENGE